MNELLQRISTLFKKYGIKCLTIDDIARELGISKNTLYQHFENKSFFTRFCLILKVLKCIIVG